MFYLKKRYVETTTLLKKITPSFDKPNFVVDIYGNKINDIITADTAEIRDALIQYHGYIVCGITDGGDSTAKADYDDLYVKLNELSNTVLYVSKTPTSGSILTNTDLVTMYDAGHFKTYDTLEITHWEMKGSNMTKKAIDVIYLDGHFVEKGSEAYINDYSVIKIVGIR